MLDAGLASSLAAELHQSAPIAQLLRHNSCSCRLRSSHVNGHWEPNHGWLLVKSLAVQLGGWLNTLVGGAQVNAVLWMDSVSSELNPTKSINIPITHEALRPKQCASFCWQQFRFYPGGNEEQFMKLHDMRLICRCFPIKSDLQHCDRARPLILQNMISIHISIQNFCWSWWWSWWMLLLMWYKK